MRVLPSCTVGLPNADTFLFSSMTCRVSILCKEGKKYPKSATGQPHPTVFPVLMNQSPWYALRTFNCQEQKVSRFLSSKGCEHFIPMTFAPSEEGTEGPPLLTPAVHNLLFMQKCGTAHETASLLSECPVPVSIFRHPGDKEFCEISSLEMSELRMLCDPRFTGSVYMPPSEADILVGKEVRVVQGPFKGSTGKLVRKNKLYYFLKVFVGMGVMVRISRWYCEAIQP